MRQDGYLKWSRQYVTSQLRAPLLYVLPVTMFLQCCVLARLRVVTRLVKFDMVLRSGGGGGVKGAVQRSSKQHANATCSVILNTFSRTIIVTC